MITHQGYITPAIRLKWVFTVGSAILSGLFGYLSAEGVMGLNIILMLIFAGVAYGLAWSVEQRAFSIVLGDHVMAKIMTVIAIPCLVFNTIADYSSAAAVRNIVATRVGDLNRVTNDKVGEVKRLEKRIGELKGGWKTNYLSPDAYQAEIDNLQGDFLYKRSKGCTDTSLPDSRAHCAKLASAKAHKSMAEQRQKEDKEVYELGIQLASAKEASAGVTTHANATEAATKAFVSWALLTRNLTEDNTVWGQNAVLLFSTVILMLLIAGLSHYIGTMHGREFVATQGGEPVSFTAPRLDGPPAAKEPIPLRPVDPTANLVVINDREQPNTSANDQLRSQALSILAEVEARLAKSGFARKEGTA